MFYFAYGSNLNHSQMRYRCEGSKYKKKFILKGYKLIFSYRDPKEPYGYANIEKKKKSKVPGAIWNISKKDEKRVIFVRKQTLYELNAACLTSNCYPKMLFV